MRGVVEILGIAILAGLILTAYDGAFVGEYRWQSLKLFVYSMALGAMLFLVPYIALIATSFLVRTVAKKKWSVLLTHRFALVGSTVVAALLLWGGYYARTHATG